MIVRLLNRWLVVVVVAVGAKAMIFFYFVLLRVCAGGGKLRALVKPLGLAQARSGWPDRMHCLLALPFIGRARAAGAVAATLPVALPVSAASVGGSGRRRPEAVTLAKGRKRERLARFGLMSSHRRRRGCPSSSLVRVVRRWLLCSGAACTGQRGGGGGAIKTALLLLRTELPQHFDDDESAAVAVPLPPQTPCTRLCQKYLSPHPVRSARATSAQDEAAAATASGREDTGGGALSLFASFGQRIRCATRCTDSTLTHTCRSLRRRRRKPKQKRQ